MTRRAGNYLLFGSKGRARSAASAECRSVAGRDRDGLIFFPCGAGTHSPCPDYPAIPRCHELPLLLRLKH